MNRKRQKYGNRCHYCRQYIPDCLYSLDHVIPASKGGGAGDNLVAADVFCNGRKGDMSAEAFKALRYRPDLSKYQSYGVGLFIDNDDWYPVKIKQRMDWI